MGQWEIAHNVLRQRGSDMEAWVFRTDASNILVTRHPADEYYTVKMFRNKYYYKCATIEDAKTAALGRFEALLMDALSKVRREKGQ